MFVGTVLVIVLALVVVARALGSSSAPPAASPTVIVIPDPPTVAAGPGSITSQRDMMRSLYQRFRGDETRIIEEYAAAERAGLVERQSNDFGLNAEEYARRLLLDGLRKGWLPANASPPGV